jgi:hypothetical protein
MFINYANDQLLVHDLKRNQLDSLVAKNSFEFMIIFIFAKKN